MNTTKVSRYQLLFDDENNELTFKQSNEVLFQLQKEMMQMANRMVQLYWEFSGYQSDYKKQFDAYPDKEKLLEDLKYSNIRSYVYDVLSKEFNKNNTANVSALQQLVDKRYKQNWKEVQQGKRSIDSYKATIPISLHKGSIRLLKENGDYYVWLSLLSNEYKKALGIKKGRMRFKLLMGESYSSMQILDSILSGEFHHTSSSLGYRDGKWSLNLGYQFEAKEPKLRESRVMGIDLGVVKPLVIAYNDMPPHHEIDSNEIQAFRDQMHARRRALGRQTKYCAESNIGHGVKTRTKALEKLKQAEANFRDRINHQYSRYVVNLAVKYGCKTIQMEDLTGISKKDTFLKNWPYYDLQTKIEYKARENGIDVVKINPRFTSQRCSKCGFISPENRPDQATFQCKKCGFGINADRNAATNIAQPGIEKIIQETIKQMSAKGKSS